MVTILSGFESEMLHTGRANYCGSSDDFAGSQVYASLVADDEEGMARYTQWCAYRARKAVFSNWLAAHRRIEAVF